MGKLFKKLKRDHGKSTHYIQILSKYIMFIINL